MPKTIFTILEYKQSTIRLNMLKFLFNSFPEGLLRFSILYVIYVLENLDCEDLEVKLISSNTIKTQNINTDNLTVKVNNVADYVFDKDYNLRPLNEVEQFVKENKHLPDIPKGTDLEQNGMNIAEMNNLLLQKIEELTLYMIELKKENEELRTLINNK